MVVIKKTAANGGLSCQHFAFRVGSFDTEHTPIYFSTGRWLSGTSGLAPHRATAVYRVSALRPEARTAEDKKRSVTDHLSNRVHLEVVKPCVFS
jgi:hypothetical protein